MHRSSRSPILDPTPRVGGRRRRRLDGAGAVVAVATAALLAGCAGAAADPGATDPAGDGIGAVRYDGEWGLVDISGTRDDVDPTVASVSLVIAGSEVGGSGGCNTYGSELTGLPGTFELGPIVRTEMACTDAGVQDLENAYLGALEDVETAALEGDSLTLETFDGAVLSFERTAPAPDLDADPDPAGAGDGVDPDSSVSSDSGDAAGISAVRYDGEWALVAIDGPTSGGADPSASDAPVTLVIDGASVSGSAGCNRYSSELTGLAGSFELADIVTTKMACAPAEMRLERTVLEGLGHVESAELQGSQLRLTSASSLVFTFERTAPAPDVFGEVDPAG